MNGRALRHFGLWACLAVVVCFFTAQSVATSVKTMTMQEMADLSAQVCTARWNGGCSSCSQSGECIRVLESGRGHFDLRKHPRAPLSLDSGDCPIAMPTSMETVKCLEAISRFSLDRGVHALRSRKPSYHLIWLLSSMMP